MSAASGSAAVRCLEDERARDNAQALLLELVAGDPDRRTFEERADGAHLVAEALATLGLLNPFTRNQCALCPVARYLFGATGLPWFVYPTQAHQPGVAPSYQAVTVDMPAPVGAFVTAFDRGEFT